MIQTDINHPPRHRRDPQRPEAAGHPRERRITIATKLGVVMGAMTVITALVAAVLFVQLRQVTTTYDTILTSEVRSALLARSMQVEFKKQVQEWKDILLRGFNPEDLATYTRQFREQSGRVDQLGDQMLATTTDDAVRAEVHQFKTEHEGLNRNYDAALAAFVAAGAKDPRVPDQAVRGQDRPPTNRVDAIVARLETAVTDRIAAQDARVAAQQRVLVIVGAAALLLVLGTLAFVVAGIVRPVRALTRAAYQAAHQTLPDAIGQIQRSDPGAPPPRMPPVEVRTRDELQELAAALSSMQSSAVDLAMEQHRAEREAAEMLINLGRRNQGLLKRTLGYISELESQENDPDVLARLFRLDHATTRVRRNAESMLVLAGAGQTRTWSQPVPVADAVRGALSEVEDYARVDLHHIEDAAVTGGAVADLIHLIAELVENATSFSPPASRVTVVGQRLSGSYRLRIIDQGVGMTSAELDAANGRIARAADGHADSPLLGLYVVGRLAARRGISVELEPSAGRGITASVTLPPKLLGDDAPAPDRTAVGTVPAPGGPRGRSDVHVVPHPRPAGTTVAFTAAAVPTDDRPAALADWPDTALAGSAGPPTVGADLDIAAGIGMLSSPPPEWFDTRPTTTFEPRRADDTPAADGHGIPRRVRGAQLPDLGSPAGSGPAFAAPDPAQVRRQLSALSAGAERAQTDRAGIPPSCAAGDTGHPARSIRTPPPRPNPRSERP